MPTDAETTDAPMKRKPALKRKGALQVLIAVSKGKPEAGKPEAGKPEAPEAPESELSPKEKAVRVAEIKAELSSLKAELADLVGEAEADTEEDAAEGESEDGEGSEDGMAECPHCGKMYRHGATEAED